MFDQVKERLLAPLDVVEDDYQRPLGGGALQLSFGRPRRSPQPMWLASVSPSSERIAAAAAVSGGSTSSCFTTSTTGQYVIPSP